MNKNLFVSECASEDEAAETGKPLPSLALNTSTFRKGMGNADKKFGMSRKKQPIAGVFRQKVKPIDWGMEMRGEWAIVECD